MPLSGNDPRVRKTYHRRNSRSPSYLSHSVESPSRAEPFQQIMSQIQQLRCENQELRGLIQKSPRVRNLQSSPAIREQYNSSQKSAGKILYHQRPEMELLRDSDFDDRSASNKVIRIGRPRSQKSLRSQKSMRSSSKARSGRKSQMLFGCSRPASEVSFRTSERKIFGTRKRSALSSRSRLSSLEK